VTDEPSVHQHINDLVAEEHTLRERLANGEITADEEHARLKVLETELDRLWDLLRQRQARSEFGQDPSEAAPRSDATVEGYLQ
jgi:predicted nuclease with TOPRIM domain